MGNALAREAPPALQRRLSRVMRTHIEITFAGLDGSGKSTLAQAMDTDSGPRLAVPTVPTIGLVVQRVMHSGIEVSVWDLGGSPQYREAWGRYASGCAALIFVFDVSNQQRLPEARKALHMLLDDSRLRGMPLLVIASKYDLIAPSDRVELERLKWAPLASLLNLDCITEHKWNVLGVSAKERINFEQLTRWIVLQAHSGGSVGPESAARRRVWAWDLNASMAQLAKWVGVRERQRAETEFTLLGAGGGEPPPRT